MLETPILFLIFNRPKETKCVFDRIRDVQPRYLFVAADGARPNVLTDAKRCADARAIVEKIDWACEVKYLFRQDNLGCKHAVSSAITWFFEQVEEGIILEDDCVPHRSFFTYCEKMLELHRHNEQVMHISGSNYLFNRFADRSNAYFFSAYIAVWGWATWRRAWNNFSLEFFDASDIYAIMAENIKNEAILHRHMATFQMARTGKIDSWATYWNYHCLLRRGKSATPYVNLIKNIGLDGVHYKGFRNPLLHMPTKAFVASSMKVSELETVNFEVDNIAYRNLLNPPFSYFDRFYNLCMRHLSRWTK